MAYTPASTLQAVEALYIGYFGRAGEPGGVAYWVNQINNGQTFAQAAAAFSVQAEAKAQHPFLANPTLVSPADFVESLYQQLFSRASDAAGKAYWVAQLSAAGGNPFAYGLIVAQFISGAQNSADGNDLDVIKNKVTAAEYFTGKLAGANIQGTDDKGQVTTAVDAAATDVISGVTKDAASITAANTKTDAFVNGGGSNNGLTLVTTSKVDLLNGGNFNDKFIASADGATVTTLVAGDQLNGGSGEDTLQLFGNGNAAAFGQASIKAIEIVQAQVAAAGATALDVSGNADVKTAGLIGGSTGANTVTLTKAQAGYAQGKIDGVTTFAFASVGGTADTANLTLDTVSGTGVGITVAGIETLNIANTGKSNIGTLTAANLETLKLSGSGMLTAVVAGGSNLKTVDAASNTGGFTLDISAGAATDLTVTGTSAKDELGIAYGNLTKADKINLGDGVDTLAFNGSNAAFTTAAQVEALSGVTNVEVLKIGSGGWVLSADGDLVAQTTFGASGSSSFTLTNVKESSTLNFEAGNHNSSTAALKLGATTLNVNLAGSATAASTTSDIDVGNDTLTVTGSTKVNVSSTGTAGVAQNGLTLIAADNQTVTVTGSQDLTLKLTAATGVTGDIVNASAFTGKLTVVGTAVADAITGGTGADSINGGAGADTLTGGAGNDTFVFAGGQTGLTLGNFDTVTDFKIGEDKLQFTAVDVVSAQQAGVQSAVTALGAGATAAQIATAMATANTTANGVSFAVYEGNTYVYYELTAAGTGVVADDAFIKLQGVTTLPVFANDVIA